MKPITYLQLLNAAILVMVMTALVTAARFLDWQGRTGLFPAAVMFTSMVVGGVLGLLLSRIARSGGKLAEPVSDKVGFAILETALSVWAVIVGLLIVLALFVGRASLAVEGCLVTLLALGLLVGRLAQPADSKPSIMPYALGLTCALVLMAGLVLVTRH